MLLTTGWKTKTAETEDFWDTNMDYPDPLIFEPLRLPHQQTFILLHGRGSWAEKFGSELLRTPIHIHRPAPPRAHCNKDKPPTAEPAVTLRTAFPHARFVFPTAARRRATIYKRSRIHQWFDNWKLDPTATVREELQIEGLHETTKYLHQLLRAEISVVPGGAKNVVIGGLSQGCAASLVALLMWEGEELGAIVGMCGWLPFAESLIAEIRDNLDEQHDDESLGFDPFAVDACHESESSDGTIGSPAQRAVAWLRKHLDLPALQQPSGLLQVQRISIFLGHGGKDEKVSIELGRRASECLNELGARVCWSEYDDLGHWYSDGMLNDMLHFLAENIGNLKQAG